MHRFLLPLFAGLVLVSCGGSAESAEAELEGTWKPDPAFLDEMFEKQKVPAAMRPQAKEMAGQMRITFKDGKLSGMMPGEGAMSGTYTVKSRDGNNITVATESKGKKEEQVLVLDGDSLSMTHRGETMKFVRVK